MMVLVRLGELGFDENLLSNELLYRYCQVTGVYRVGFRIYDERLNDGIDAGEVVYDAFVAMGFQNMVSIAENFCNQVNARTQDLRVTVDSVEHLFADQGVYKPEVNLDQINAENGVYQDKERAEQQAASAAMRDNPEILDKFLEEKGAFRKPKRNFKLCPEGLVQES